MEQANHRDVISVKSIGHLPDEVRNTVLQFEQAVGIAAYVDDNAAEEHRIEFGVEEADKINRLPYDRYGEVKPTNHLDWPRKHIVEPAMVVMDQPREDAAHRHTVDQSQANQFVEESVFEKA